MKYLIILQNTLQDFIKDKRGVTAIEYGILAGALALGLSALFSKDGAFLKALTDSFTGLAGKINGK